VGELPWQQRNGLIFGQGVDANQLADIWTRIHTFNEQIEDDKAGYGIT
jgi:hypothetical protein